jgi:peptide-methionine (S)-S-oxide reductase
MPLKTLKLSTALKRLLPLGALVAGGLAIAPFALAAGGLQTAVFAGGCFWTMEHDFETVPGVVSAVSGYTGGREQHPTYEQVSSETTGHVESVRVTFDPSRVSYAALVEDYWRFIDPTDGGGQACDRGASYHSAIFVAGAAQRQVADASKARLQTKLRGRVVTPVRDASTFWPAESYHQQYASNHPMEYRAYRVGCGRDVRLKELWGVVPR